MLESFLVESFLVGGAAGAAGLEGLGALAGAAPPVEGEGVLAALPSLVGALVPDEEFPPPPLVEL